MKFESKLKLFRHENTLEIVVGKTVAILFRPQRVNFFLYSAA